MCCFRFKDYNSLDNEHYWSQNSPQCVSHCCKYHVKLLSPYTMFVVIQNLISYHAPTSKNFVTKWFYLSEAHYPICNQILALVSCDNGMVLVKINCPTKLSKVNGTEGDNEHGRCLRKHRHRHQGIMRVGIMWSLLYIWVVYIYIYIW